MLAPTAQAMPGCIGRRINAIDRLARLPADARTTLGAMAERGGRWEPGDALGPAPRPPSRRFISARQTGCTLVVRYEQGGIAHHVRSAILTLRGTRWVLVSNR
jgi:hypothetical protein